MTTVQWLSVIATLMSAAVVWGTTKNELGNLRTQLAELRRDHNDSSRDQGQRIGKLETAVTVQRALTASRGVPVHVDRDESGERR